MSKHGATSRCPAWAGVAVLTLRALGAPAVAAPLPLHTAAALPTADADCLAEAVYYEAGGEARAGQEAVAGVVLNRLRDPAYPKTVCGVVFQGARRPTGCQFTFACDGSRARRPPGLQAWRDAQALAADALSGRLSPGVGVATHYHALWAHPVWAAGLQPTLRIGGHQFYAANDRALGPAVHAAPVVAPAPRTGAFSVWGLEVATASPAADGGAQVSER